MVGQKQGPAAAAPRRFKKLLPEWFLVMFLLCFEVWLGRTAADKPACAAPQRRLGYTVRWLGRRRRAPTLQKATPLACAAIVVASFPKLFSNVSLWPRRVNALSLSGACCSHTSSDFKKWLHLSSRARVNISRNFDTQRRTPLHANTQLLKQLPLCSLSSIYIYIYIQCAARITRHRAFLFSMIFLIFCFWDFLDFGWSDS